MIRVILSILVLFTSVKATAYPSCNANLYFTTSIAANSFFSPAGCGKVNSTQKWSSLCVDSLINQAYWHGNLSTNFSYRNQTYRFTYGYVSYFIVEYQAHECDGDIQVPSKDALYMGSVNRNGRIQKLYAVLGNANTFNTLVQLSRGIDVIYAGN